MHQQDTFKKYSLGFSGVTLLLLMIIVVFNLVVAPLASFRLVTKPGYNEFKPAFAKYTRIAKPIQVEWYQPKTVVFGSSRIELGINMSYPVWQKVGEPAFNNGVIAIPMTDLKLLTFHGMAATSVETMIIGVNFFMFNALRRDTQKIAYEQVLAVNSAGERQPLHKLSQLLVTLLSKDVFSSGIRTINNQGQQDRKFTRDGQRINDIHITRKILRKGGYHVFFKNKQIEVAVDRVVQCKEPYSYNDGQVDTMAILHSILSKASENNIKVVVFMPPVHAWWLETYSSSGLWQEFEQWKRDLTTQVENINQHFPDTKNIALWDFNVYNAYTTEIVPEPGDIKTIMKWYIDPSHYRETLGNLIMETALINIDHHLGIRLTSNNIEAHLKANRIAKRRFQKQNKKVIDKIIKENSPLYAEQIQKRASCG
jgi:hypothetical protein